MPLLDHKGTWQQRIMDTGTEGEKDGEPWLEELKPQKEVLQDVCFLAEDSIAQWWYSHPLIYPAHTQKPSIYSDATTEMEKAGAF